MLRALEDSQAGIFEFLLFFSMRVRLILRAVKARVDGSSRVGGGGGDGRGDGGDGGSGGGGGGVWWRSCADAGAGGCGAVGGGYRFCVALLFFALASMPIQSQK